MYNKRTTEKKAIYFLHLHIQKNLVYAFIEGERGLLQPGGNTEESVWTHEPRSTSM